MNWLTVILCILAGFCAIWAVAGLFSPQDALSFALPVLQNRGNAFWFYMRFAIAFALIAVGWETTDPGLAILLGLVAGFMLSCAVRRLFFLHGMPLQRMGIILPSERHLFNQG